MKLKLLIIFLMLTALNLTAAEIWVSTQGNDNNPGTSISPKASLKGALRQARELRRINDPSIKNGIDILMKGGSYIIDQVIMLRPEDSGTPESPTTIQAAKGENPVINGGLKVTGWKKFKSKNNIWFADLDSRSVGNSVFRQVYVNGKKAVQSAMTNDENLLRIIDVDKSNNTIRVPLKGVKNIANTSELEFFIHQMWETAVLRVKSVKYEKNQAVLSFHEPESRLEFEHPWPPPVISEKGNSVFQLKGALEFVDEPGEWFHDKKANRLYYLPRQNEDILKAEVIVPGLETLVLVTGSKENPVKNIVWKGITFSHSNWTRPSLQGYVPLQAGMFLLDAYKLQIPGTPDKASLENQAWIGRQPAAVLLQNTRNITFDSCIFKHCGASGLDFAEGSQFDKIINCRFEDIAGSGLVAGKFSDPGVETHLPYDPTDKRELCRNMKIKNNVFYNIANEYWGCVGIIAGYVSDFVIENNHLSELAYSGISVGWGWTKTINCMKNNVIRYNLVEKFGKHNYSCGGIYTLSAQPGTIISENCIKDIYKPAYVHDNTGYFIYLDEASSFIMVKNNWCSEKHFGQNQTSNIYMENNGPEVDILIKEKAGLVK